MIAKGILAFVCALTFWAPTHASAATMTGNEFIENCTSADLVKKSYCLGFITGLLDGVVVGRYGSTPYYCLPPGVTVGQIMAMTLKLLEERPQERHESARSTIAVMLNNAFPCKAPTN